MAKPGRHHDSPWFKAFWPLRRRLMLLLCSCIVLIWCWVILNGRLCLAREISQAIWRYHERFEFAVLSFPVQGYSFYKDSSAQSCSDSTNCIQQGIREINIGFDWKYHDPFWSIAPQTYVDSCNYLSRSSVRVFIMTCFWSSRALLQFLRLRRKASSKPSMTN